MLRLLPILWAALAAQAPDRATTARYAGALQTVADSLTGVRGAVASFRADLAAASPALVLARAARVRARCVAARTAVAQLRAVVASDYTPHARRAQQALRDEATGLTRALQRCEREWDVALPGASADSLRAWGPYRIERLETAMRRYHTRAGEFQKRAGMK